MKRCVKCILPETAKGIVLDQTGLCQFCRDYKEFTHKGEDALRKEIENFINDKDKKFNCIVPVSGGRDSSYALYYAKEVLRLKPLAVHNDNDFETEIANKNLETITKRLDVPLIRVNSKTHLSKKIVREKIKMNAPFGAGLIVDQACEACQYGFESASYNTAKKNGIKLIIWGDSKDESTAPYHQLIQHLHKIPTKLQRLTSSAAINYLKYKYYFSKMKKEYGSNLPTGLREIHLYDYIRWDRKLIVDTIQNKLGWSVSKGSPTSWRIDCALVPVINYLTEQAFGVSKIELGFSNMVRNGKMDRNDALSQVEQIKKNTHIDDLKTFLKEFDVSSDIIHPL